MSSDASSRTEDWNTPPVAKAKADEPPLCVDLDGTLSITDTLLECLLIVIKRQPYLLFVLPLWILGGRAQFKQKIYKLARLNPATLGYREPFLTYLKSEAARGRRIILATAAPEIFARAIADYLDCFTDVVGTREGHNLKGKNKAKALVDLYGERGFDYAGNDWPDNDVWAHARRAIIVAAPASLRAKVEKEREVDRTFDGVSGGVRACLRAMRVHQWSKNVLVFVPLVAAHRVFEPMLLLYTIVTFFSFGLIASGGYIVNDLLDLASDRKHPRKRKRPFASGSLSIQTGVILAISLILAGLVLTATISLT
ncbi:MAG: UbiA family prenyltransferase, partial [Alphaproteobacteria bacterium]